VGHKVHLQEPWPGLVPVGERPYRNLMFDEERAWLGGAAPQRGFGRCVLSRRSMVAGLRRTRSLSVSGRIVNSRSPLSTATISGKKGAKHLEQMHPQLPRPATGQPSRRGVHARPSAAVQGTRAVAMTKEPAGLLTCGGSRLRSRTRPGSGSSPCGWPRGTWVASSPPVPVYSSGASVSPVRFGNLQY